MTIATEPDVIAAHRPRRAMVRVILVTALITLCTGVLWAHAKLVSSSPAAEAHLREPPTALRLEFNEAVTARTSRIELVGPDSQRAALAPRGDSANPRMLLAELPSLSIAGRYAVEWRLVGPDGHAVSGRYAFYLDAHPMAADTQRVDTTRVASPETSAPVVPESLLQQASRFLFLLALLLVTGSTAFALFVLRPVVRSGAGLSTFGEGVEARLRSTATVAAWTLLVLAVVRLTSHAVLLSGSFAALRIGDIDDLLFGSTFGRGWLLLVAATISLLLGLRASSVRWSALAYGSMVLAIAASFLGHPAAVAQAPSIAMGLDAVHVAAAGGWAGGILILAFVAMPQLHTSADLDRFQVARTLLRAFSPVAVTCAMVLGVTGAIAGWLQLRDLGMIMGSAYGLMLFRKVVVVLMVAALGAYHWRVAAPAMESDAAVGKLRVSLALDVVLVLGVIALTAMLTGTAPPVLTP